MVAEWRESLDAIIMSTRAGRMKRRTFMGRALALGLSTCSAASLLEACGSITTSCTPKSWANKPNYIVWNSEHDSLKIYSNIVSDFRNQHPEAHILYMNAPFKDQYTSTVSALQTCSNEMDVVSIDIIWLSEFAKKQWILPTSNQIELAVQNKYGGTPGIIESCKYEGKLYSAPMRVDIGVLYYNKLLATPPATWDDLVNQADAKMREKKIDGYVWQGAPYEGLVCNFVEVLAGYGGAILSKNDPHKVTINSPEARDALAEMVNWIWSAKISPAGPTGILTYQENDARVRWQNGFAVFMRNWFNAYSEVTDAVVSAVHDDVGYIAIPHARSQSQGHSCIGGWQLGVNASSQNQDLCWEFIDFMLRSNHMGYPISDIYDNSDNAALKSIFKQGVMRPQSPNYAQISQAIQTHVYQALTKEETVANALKKIEDRLKQLVSDE